MRETLEYKSKTSSWQKTVWFFFQAGLHLGPFAVFIQADDDLHMAPFLPQPSLATSVFKQHVWPERRRDTNSVFPSQTRSLGSGHTPAVSPRLVDSLVVRLRLCCGSPDPVPEAWGGGEDEMETWEPVLLL